MFGRGEDKTNTVLYSGSRCPGAKPGPVIAFCSWIRHLTLAFPKSSQTYEWLSANYQGSLLKCWGGGIFEELVPIQVEVKSVLKPELNMPVSIALSDKEYHHSPLYGMPVHPKVTLRHFIRLSWQFSSTPGWRDTLWVHSTMTRPGHEPRLLDLESSALTMRPSPTASIQGG